MAYKVLLVTADQQLQGTLTEQLEPYFTLYFAKEAAEGLAMLQHRGPFAVAVVDYGIADPGGVEFMAQARRLSPSTVRVIFNAEGNLQAVVDAINRGNVYHYLTRPLDQANYCDVVICAAEKYRQAGRVITTQEPGRLKGLGMLYRALVFWDQKRYGEALQHLKVAANIFQKEGSAADLARARVYMAGVMIEGKLAAGDESQGLSLFAITRKAVRFYLDQGFPVLNEQEQAYYKPVMEWALQHDLEKAALADLFARTRLVVTEQPLIKVKTLGLLEVMVDGRLIEEKEWRYPKVKMVFLFLLSNRHKKMERDIILDTFWPEMNLRDASNNFSTTLYLLRRLLGSEQVVYRHEHCWLERRFLYCDVEDFEALAASGFKKRLEGKADEASAIFEEALVLYRGDYLEEFAYKDWIIAERKRLQMLFQKTLSHYAATLAEKNRFIEAAETLERAQLVALYDEEILLALINYYLLAGKKDKALKRFQYYAAEIFKEQGIKPDGKIIELLSGVQPAGQADEETPV